MSDITIYDQPRFERVGAWSELLCDAELQFLGITWKRVKGGFGHRNDREDWIADVPGACIAVTRHRLDTPGYGWQSNLTRETAMEFELDRGLQILDHNIEDDIAKLASRLAGRAMIKKARP